MYSQNLVEDDERIGRIAAEARRVAVLGIKTADQADQSAYSVPEHLQRKGLEIVPIPVYYPEVQEILGRKVYRRCADVPGPVDILQVFRRPRDVEAHVPDILAMKPLPRCVWLQTGIRNDRAAEALARAGVLVVQDRCLAVELSRLRKAR
jgi:predicted CoA-binding protein